MSLYMHTTTDRLSTFGALLSSGAPASFPYLLSPDDGFVEDEDEFEDEEYDDDYDYDDELEDEDEDLEEDDDE